MGTKGAAGLGVAALAAWLTGFAIGVPVAAASPVAQLSRAGVRFTAMGLNVMSAVQPVFVTNTGDAPLTIAAISVAGAQASDFFVGGTCAPPVTLAPAARCRLDTKVQISSASPIVRTASVTIQSDSVPAPGPIALSVSYESGIAMGFMPSPPWIDFAGQAVGTAAPVQTFTITNPEIRAAAIEAIALYGGDAGDFTLSSDCAGRTIANGGTCTATIGFSPTATGPRSTELKVDMHPVIAPNTHFSYRYSITGIGGTAAPVAVNIDQHGLTGSWFEPRTSGQGMELEVFPDLVAPGTGYLQGAWFTFDHAASGGAEHGRWYTFGGNVSAGDAAASLPLYENTGGNFNAPPVTSSVEVGSVVLGFSDCSTAQFDYAFSDGSGRKGTIPLTRLTPNVSCAPAGSLAGSGDFGLSGNWFDPATSGQGFVFELNPVARVLFFAWYAYAVNGQALGASGQRWYTGQADYVPGARSIPLLLYETTGGLFNSAAPAPTTAEVGTGTLAFASCGAAKLTFSFTAGSNAGQAGTIDLVRVGPTPGSCAY